MLPVKVINPQTGQFLLLWGLIDTGADECALPAAYAHKLGHDLASVKPRKIGSASGAGEAFPHTTRIEVLDVKGDKVVYTIPETPIDFVVGLGPALLGVKKFLNHFVLTVDYPGKVFSLQKKVSKKKRR